MGLFSFTQEIAMDLGQPIPSSSQTGKLWWMSLRLWPWIAVQIR